ncbi:unnamed protein product, partial [Cyprideis torosa]
VFTVVVLWQEKFINLLEASRGSITVFKPTATEALLSAITAVPCSMGFHVRASSVMPLLEQPPAPPRSPRTPQDPPTPPSSHKDPHGGSPQLPQGPL